VTGKLVVAFTSAQRAIERLERARIVKRVCDAKRDRVYCATALLDILEEPARLKPAQQIAPNTAAKTPGRGWVQRKVSDHNQEYPIQKTQWLNGSLDRRCTISSGLNR
jgi:hypothetical protein